MNPKMEEIESLLGKGFDLEDIRSDSESVEVIMTRGASTRVVTIDIADAADILWGRPSTEARRTLSAWH